MQSRTVTTIRLGVVFLVLGAAAGVRGEFPQLALKPVAVGQFFSPTTVTHAGDGSGRLFIADQRGKIHLLQEGMILPEPFLDVGAKLVSERAGFDERGLLGLAFHPDYAVAAAAGEGRFYLYYSAPSPDAPGTSGNPVDHRSVIAEYRVSATDPNRADAASERVLLTINQPQFNHNGGQLAFGPDGLLYVGVGDGGSSNDNNAGHTGGSSSQPSGVLGNAQDRTRLLGKVLRIDPFGSNGPGGQYGIPPSNPFVGAGGGVREEIYAYGLRNPWRFSFDHGPGGTGRLFLADVGQARFEEVNLIVAGGNYGWRRFEGFADFDAATPSTGPYQTPIAAYSRAGQAGSSGLPEIGISVTGGYVYRGSAIPALQGKYVFGDWSRGFATPNGTLLGLEETSPGVFALSVLPLVGGNPIGRFIPAFGVDEDGEIYVATKTTTAPSAPEPGTGLPSGQLFRLVGLPQPVTIEVVADRDNTIYSELPSNSNGAGDLFVGQTQQSGLRRALVHFDLGAIAPGSGIVSATLHLAVNQTVTGNAGTTVHRLTRAWGEAGSLGTGQGAPAQAGDATWNSAFHGAMAWTTPGGDFVEEESAATILGGLGPYTWTSVQLTGDVQLWVDNPAANHGWILIGNEGAASAKRLRSRENSVVTQRPRLVLGVQQSSGPTHRELWEQTHFLIGQFIDPARDHDGDGIPALLEYAWSLSPHVKNDPALHVGVEVNASAGTATATFRRDPRAVDVTYVLEVSPNLADWEAVVTSTAGGTATGPGFVADTEDPLAVPTRRVSAAVSAAPAGQGERFVRLRVFR